MPPLVYDSSVDVSCTYPAHPYGTYSGSTTITTTQPNEVVCALMSGWQGAQSNSAPTVDGVAMTKQASNYGGGGNDAEVWDITVASVGSHTFAWNVNAAYAIFSIVVFVLKATTAGAQYMAAVAANSASITVQPGGIFVCTAQQNTSVPPASTFTDPAPVNEVTSGTTGNQMAYRTEYWETTGSGSETVSNTFPNGYEAFIGAWYKGAGAQATIVLGPIQFFGSPSPVASSVPITFGPVVLTASKRGRIFNWAPSFAFSNVGVWSTARPLNPGVARPGYRLAPTWPIQTYGERIFSTARPLNPGSNKIGAILKSFSYNWALVNRVSHHTPTNFAKTFFSSPLGYYK